MFYFYVLSVVSVLVALYIIRLSFINVVHWIFLGFMILYNLFPFIIYSLIPNMNRIPLTLAKNNNIFFEKQLFLSSLLLLLYSILLFTNKNKVDLNFVGNKRVQLYINPAIIFFILLPLGIYLSSKNNWTTGAREGFSASLTAYIRNMLQVLGIITFVRYRSNLRLKTVVLISFIFLSFVDTQRTNLFVLFISYLITLKNKKNAFYMFFSLILVVVVLGSFRNNVSIFNVLYPFIGEGVFGSYGLLQVIRVLHEGYDINNLLVSLNSIYERLLSYVFINIDLDSINDYMKLMQEKGVIKERYFPMGGYFFPAGSHLALPYLGPLFQLLVFFKFIIYISNYKGDLYIKVIIYSNLFLLFKATLPIALNLIVFQIICYFLIRLINSFVKILK